MATRYKFSEEEIKGIKEARKKNRDKNAEKRLQVMEMSAEGKKAAEISAVTGFHEHSITRIIRRYKIGGLEAIAGNHYGGNRRNMSYAEEEALLAPFKAQAEKGELVAVSAIETAYREAVGHSIGTSQIYNVLHRHGWRKIMLRSRHPKKASEEVIATSKKLTPKSKS